MIHDAKRYYAMLGVVPGCSDEEIRVAFRRLAKEVHPDSESGSASAFIRLKKAYDTLSDPAKRADYDYASRPRRIRRLPEWELMTNAPRPPRYRLGGMSVTRFAAAFVFMTGLSFVAIDMMLDDADVPLSAMFDFGAPKHPVPPPATAQRKQFSLDTRDALEIQPGESQADFQERLQRVKRSSETLNPTNR